METDHPSLESTPGPSSSDSIEIVASQNTHKLPSSQSIAATVTHWYTRFAALLGFGSPSVDEGDDLNGYSGERSITGLSFHLFLQ
jgi:hypothetical protein